MNNYSKESATSHVGSKDALRLGREAIRREIEEKVPALLADGGFIPLADGRMRAEIPFEDYAYYRRLLAKKG